MSSAITVPPARLLLRVPRLELELGGALEHALVGYEVVGPERGPLVVVQGGISADAHPCAHDGDPSRGWWEDLVGPGRAIDTESVRVLSLDWLGGTAASSGPATHAPFPLVTAADQARATELVLDALGVERAHGFVGASFGGQVGLALAARAPERLDRLVAIAAAHEPHALATAWRGLQRRILDWGECRGDARGAAALARALALATYCGASGLAERFGAAWSADAPIHSGDGGAGRDGGTWREPLAPIERWLLAHGRDWAERFEPAAYRSLSLAIDLSRVDPRDVRVPTTLVAFEGDQLVPPALVEVLAARLGAACDLHVLPTRFGHDAFLKEPARLGRVVRAALGASHRPTARSAREEVRS